MQKSSDIILSLKYMIIVGIFSLSVILMVANTMFSVFYSVSNLGALNIGSAVIVILIDQCAIRVILGASILLAAKIIISLTKNSVQNEANAKI